MKHIRRTLCFAALALAFSMQVRAAEDVSEDKKTASEVREAAPPQDAGAQAQSSAASPSPAGLSGQMIYQVLLAEIALQRGNAELASKAYSSLALRTRDPKVLERTVEVAGYARRFDLATEAARMWLEIEPDSVRARQLLTSVMILSNKLDELAPNLIRMLESDKNSLAANLLGLNRTFARHKDRLAVYVLLEKVCRPFFGLAEAHYTVAMAASSAGVHERALAEVLRALELRPDWDMAALLGAQLVSRESPDKGIAFLQEFVERNPGAHDAQLHLARALVGEKRYAEAQKHFDQLLKDFPDNPEVVYPVAILALQQNNLELAESQFKHLLTLSLPDKSIAYYYLGQITEETKRNDEALAYYSKVGPGEQYLNAQMRRANILAGQGQLDLARKLLSEANVSTPEQKIQFAIAEAGLLRQAKQTQAAFDLLDTLFAGQPEQPDLLYETALLAERLGRMDVLETRLRKLIELRPDSAQAYNALGYSFADRNQRLPEARELIEKALKLAPDDVFILDSMGWVLFRQGDLPGALTYLERAYGRRDDAEIAAHLAEVLWASNRQDEARGLLRTAQQKHPANEALAETVKKFAP